MSKTMIEIEDLTKKYGSKEILNGININIQEKDIYGIIGVSGAGKSTLLRCINGLETFQQGKLIVGEIDIKSLNKDEMRKFRSNIGMVFQHFSLIERSNVYDNIAFPMRCWGYKEKEIKNKVKDLLSLVGLSEKINSFPRMLSGGQKQRVAIARALTLNPKILLCDEATSALDPNITISILELLEKINKELGVTIIIVTHQMEVIKNICKNVAILSNGKLEASGKVEKIFFEEPPVLNEVLGVSKVDHIINSETVLKIFIDAKTQGDIFSKISAETSIDYKLISGSYDQYRNNIYGIFYLECGKDQISDLKKYFDRQSIEWREI